MAAEEEIVDRMSDLPDKLLCHILSFLPFHTLLRMRTVSTRFRYLWRSVPALDLRDNEYRPHAFKKIMDHVVKNHENLAMVKRFRLLCFDCSYGEPVICRWVDLLTSLSRSNLEVFRIHLSRQIVRNLPPSQYHLDLSRMNITCQKLKTIWLSGKIVIEEIPINVRVFFPCLKTFRLKGVSIVGGNTLNKLLSGSPLLEIFKVEDCFIDSDRDRFANFNLPEVTIKMLYLEYLVKPSGIHDVDGDSNHVLSPGSASIQVTHQSKVALDFLKSIRNMVKDLVIDNIDNVSFENIDDNGAIVWQNLTHLVVKLNDSPSHALPFLVGRAPNLVSLVLEKGIMWDNMRFVLPSVSYSKLETVKIIVSGGFEEMEIVEYFLKNASVLKKLILCYGSISEEMKATIVDEHRASGCEPFRITLVES
ncbi:hypothetical protein GQ457_12G006300 [Hibiscus cannabinus]